MERWRRARAQSIRADSSASIAIHFEGDRNLIMARRVFFSFHHQQDSWRVGQVRNSWLLQKGTTNTFMDAAAWESVQRKGDASIRTWIDRELVGTGVTVVLIGAQ